MTSETSAPSSKGFRRFQLEVLASTWLAYFGLYFCRKTFAVAKATLGTDYGLSTTNLGDIDGYYLAAYAVGQFISAGLGSKVGPRVLLLGGIAISIFSNVVFGFTDNMLTFSIFMVVNGLAQSAGWPACIGTLASWIRKEERGTIMGFWATCYQFGGLAATAWAAFWLKEQGVRGAFLASSAFVCLVWLVVFIFQRDRPRDRGLQPIPDGELRAEDDLFNDEHALLEEKSIWTAELILNISILGIFYFGMKFLRYALQSWLPFFLEKNFGVAADNAGYLSTVFEAAGIFGTLFAGIVSDRIFKGKRTPIAFAMLVGMTLGTLGLFMSLKLGVGFFVASVALIGFMLYGPDSLLTGAGAMDVGSKKAALVAAGVINGVGAIGASLQSVVIGRIYDQDGGQLDSILRLLIVAALLSLGAVAVLLIRARRGNAQL